MEDFRVRCLDSRGHCFPVGLTLRNEGKRGGKDDAKGFNLS